MKIDFVFTDKNNQQRTVKQARSRKLRATELMSLNCLPTCRQTRAQVKEKLPSTLE
jgi:hypothetical protein